jgi:hypothetical protein
MRRTPVATPSTHDPDNDDHVASAQAAVGQALAGIEPAA